MPSGPLIDVLTSVFATSAPSAFLNPVIFPWVSLTGVTIFPFLSV